MNLYNKKICILGHNDCFAKGLIKQLLSLHTQLHILEQPSHLFNLNNMNFLDTLLLNKNSVDDNNIEIIKEADIIINLTLSPTPNTLARNIYPIIKFNEYLVNHIQPNGLLIHLTPLIIKDSFSAYNSLFHNISTSITHKLSNYIILNVGHIIASDDSFIRDICDLIYLTKSAMPYGKHRVSLIDKQSLILSIIKIIQGNSNTKSYDLAYVSQCQINDIVSIISQNMWGINNIKALPTPIMKFLLFMKKHHLYSLNKNYLNTILQSKKTSVSTLGLKDLGIIQPSIDFIVNQELSYILNNRKNQINRI